MHELAEILAWLAAAAGTAGGAAGVAAYTETGKKMAAALWDRIGRLFESSEKTKKANSDLEKDASAAQRAIDNVFAFATVAASENERLKEAIWELKDEKKQLMAALAAANGRKKHRKRKSKKKKQTSP